MPRRTRLRFVSHSFAPRDAPLGNVGGMQRVAMELARALSVDPGVELRLDVLRSRWDRIALNAPVFLSSLPVRLARNATRTDVVLFSSMTSAAAALPALPKLRGEGVAIAAIAHGLDVTHTNPAYQLAIRSVLPRLDHVLPVSRATAQQCAARGARTITVVPNAVDASRFDEALASRLAPPVRTSIPGGGPHETVVLAVGRQVRRKGFAWFVESVLPELPEDVVFVLVGDGPEREAIEHAAALRGVESRVRIEGLVSERALVSHLARADVLVMPNLVVPGDMEGFGVVLLEAAAAGLPVIAADLEGMRDVVLPGETGTLVPSADAAAFVRAVLDVRDRPALARARGLAGRRYVTETLSWDAVAARYLAVIDRARAASVA